MSEGAFAEALRHHEAGRRAEAAIGYRVILAEDPLHADSLHLLGLISVEQNDPAGGIALIRRAMCLDPGRAAYHNSLGQAYHRLGLYKESVKSFETAAELLPGRAEIHNNLAASLLQLGQGPQAIEHYRLAAGFAPAAADVWYNLANALLTADAPVEAESCFRRAIALRGDFAAAYANYGRLLTARFRWAEAEANLARALHLMPDQPAAWNNLGIILRERDLGRAETCFRNALTLDTSSAQSHYNLGCVLSAQGRTDEAVASHEAALWADPCFAGARLACCMAHLSILYETEEEIVRRRQDYTAALRELAASAEPTQFVDWIGSSQPFFLPYQQENDRAAQSLYGELACRIMADALPAPRLAAWSGERIRLGIVSGFFRDHTLFKLFLQGWLTRIDRDRFEIIGFHTGRTSDEQTAWCAGACDRFVQGLPSVAAWRAAVEAAEPHILLYPEVGIDPTAGHLAAVRLAPLQCVAWGQPVTTGMPTIDAFLSSELMEPADAQAFYTERLVCLPHLGMCYQPEATSERRLDRATLGLDPDGTVFWSGQAIYKYLPRYDAIFPRIATAVGRCQFVFIAFAQSPALTDVFRARLEGAFTAVGLDARHHVVILPPLAQPDYVAAVGLADVVLDTPGWSGGKSTLDCLAADPAIVTMPGRFMRGRHTAAILRRIGCEATITRSVDEYVAVAARLARDTEWRMDVRQNVARGQTAAYDDEKYIATRETSLAVALAGQFSPSTHAPNV